MVKKHVAAFVIQAFFWWSLIFLPGEGWGDPILEGAKKEGQVSYSTPIELPISTTLGALFEKKYPFIKVSVTRLGSEKAATRLISEARAGKVSVDVVTQSGFDFYGVLQKGIFERYDSPERTAFSAEYKDDQGYWVTHTGILNVISYNTSLVRPAEVPKSFWDLTDPKWKGKIIIDENESKWMAGMIRYYGEAKVMDLMRKLAAQNLQFRAGHPVIENMVAAGEFAIGAVDFASGVEMKKKQGGPIDWVGAEPIIVLALSLALVKDTPHPNAGKLFIDFLLSREGQQVLATDGYYYSPRKDVQSPIMKQVSPQMKVIPLPMDLAKRYNEYFQMYRKVMGLP